MKKNITTPHSTITFCLDYQPIDEGINVGIVGSCRMLGDWDIPVRMNKVGFRSWSIILDYDMLPEYFEYKFVLFDSSTNQITLWEDGFNRTFTKETIAPNSRIRVAFRGSLTWHGAGVAIPVFSLRRKNGWGVGEFTDLCTLADWCSLTQQKLIQILPINDTNITMSDSDSYPYRSVSVDALNPIYLNVEKICEVTHSDLQNDINEKRLLLDTMPKVSYSEVLQLKLRVLRHIYLEQRAYSDAWIKTAKLLHRFEQANSWLMPYAVFRCLIEDFSSCQFDSWGEYSRYDHKRVKQYAKDNAERVEFYYFIQYHLFEQLREVKEYLNARSILLKGDLPVGVGRYSVDVWRYSELFNVDKHAGAPPDDFSEEGQNWGFPTYNWANMAKDRYRWWRERFGSIGKIFDAFRIDHILGFFRIWEIPQPFKSGLLGYFSPSLPLSKEEIEACGITINRSNTMFYRDEIKTPTTDILFIEDPYKQSYYHPRIMACKTGVYQKLTDEQRKAFDRLYDDYFYCRHNEFWTRSALEKLPEMLETTDMLVCGEDLGMVPASVPYVMRRLNILSLEILRMPKEFGREFVDIAKVPYNSVVSTGTHDTSTLRMWWGEDESKTQRFYNDVLMLDGNAPKLYTSDIAKKILSSLFASDAMWVILPMQDYMAIDEMFIAENLEQERINYPENPHHIWNYRMHLFLEDILEKKDFNETLKQLIITNKR